MDRLEALQRVLGMIDQIRSEWGVGTDDDEEGEMLDALGATKAERAYLGVERAGHWFEALVDIARALVELDPGSNDFGFEVRHLAYRIGGQHPDIARRLRERYPHKFKGADVLVAEGHRPSGFVPFTIGWDDGVWPPPPPPSAAPDEGAR
ncbi:hypothetical protein [Nocardia farcinica]|uniref:hypothetical protein n=1 Tax=Nocardia farcinica TaxID=37329 RepID=UPI00343201DF